MRVALNIRCSNMCAKPERPAGSSFEPTSYQTCTDDVRRAGVADRIDAQAVGERAFGEGDRLERRRGGWRAPWRVWACAVSGSRAAPSRRAARNRRMNISGKQGCATCRRVAGAVNVRESCPARGGGTPSVTEGARDDREGTASSHPAPSAPPSPGGEGFLGVTSCGCCSQTGTPPPARPSRRRSRSARPASSADCRRSESAAASRARLASRAAAAISLSSVGHVTLSLCRP